MTEQIVGPSVDEHIQKQGEEIARLAMLVEAAGRLLGTLDLAAVLPDVLELAQSTLDADAYALWRVDQRDGRWTVQASAGLSDAYVAAASAAIDGDRGDVALDRPLIVNDVASAEWLTDEHKAAHAAEGTRSFLVEPLRNRGEVIGTIVFYARRSARTSTTPTCARRAAVANLAAAAVGTAAVYEEQKRACREPPPDRRSERAARVVAGLRDDALERRGARRAGARRLVRDRHRRRRGHDPAARRCPPGPGEGRAARSS